MARYFPAPHAAYWFPCEDCEQRVRELQAAGLSNADAERVAKAEHRTANTQPPPAAAA